MMNTIIFDWGDTLMVNHPTAHGAIVDWPEVAAVPGAVDALSRIYGQYRLVLATNALDSDAKKVKMALAKVGLDGYFEVIFTARELGVSKPDPAFYRAVLARLGSAPEDAMMVGDDFRADILAARRAGLRAVWYNPSGMASSPLPPVQNVEIADMAFLPQVLAGLDAHGKTLPGIEECLGVLLAHGNPPDIVAHSQVVANTAYLLGCWLRKKGEPVEPLLAHRGGLLHDLYKLEAKEKGRVHGEVAEEILLGLGQAALATIARRHPIYSVLDEDNRPQTWEQKLVYFTDKLVEGDQLVSLENRLAGLRQRYAANVNVHEKCYPFVYAMQEELCDRLEGKWDTLLVDLQARVTEPTSQESK
jgi:putative hydrolase of the HAD superfamily